MIKKILVFISKLSLIGFFVYLLFNPVGMYFEELDLYLYDVFSPFMLLIIVSVWYYLLPYRSSCGKATVFSILFHLIPVELLLLMVFAQYHFAAAILLLVLIVAASVAFRFYLRLDHEKQQSPGMDGACRRRMGRRFFVLVCSVLLAVPAIFGLFVYKLQKPVYQAATDASSLSQHSDDQTKPELSEELLGRMNEDDWKAADIDQKLELLQKIADYEADTLGSPHMHVRVTKLDESTNGQYVHGTENLYIDLGLVNFKSLKEASKTTLHELYHSYQYYVVHQIDWDSELAKTALCQDAAAWKDNYTHYINGHVDAKGYLEQPLEKSARDFADNEWDRLVYRVYLFEKNRSGISS